MTAWFISVYENVKLNLPKQAKITAEITAEPCDC